MTPLRWGMMFLLADGVLTYCMRQVAVGPEQFFIMMALAALSQCSFGLWLASGYQSALRRQREVVTALQEESEKRKAMLHALRRSVIDQQERDQQQ